MSLNQCSNVSTTQDLTEHSERVFITRDPAPSESSQSQRCGVDVKTLTQTACLWLTHDAVCELCVCVCDLSVCVTSLVFRLRAADGGELQHSEREPECRPRVERRPSQPGPPTHQHLLLPGVWWCRPDGGRPEGLAATVHQAGERSHTCCSNLRSCDPVQQEMKLFSSCCFRSRQRSRERPKIHSHLKKSNWSTWVCDFPS